MTPFSFLFFPFVLGDFDDPLPYPFCDFEDIAIDVCWWACNGRAKENPILESWDTSLFKWGRFGPQVKIEKKKRQCRY